MTEKPPRDTSPATPKPPVSNEAQGDFSLGSVSEACEPAETEDFRRVKGTAPPPQGTPNEPVLPKAYGRYTVHRPLGSGAFGTVYLGHDTQLDRPVAIKALRADKPITEEDLKDLLQEARRVAKLRHPGIVVVHDFGMQEHDVFIVSDYVEGVTLKDHLKKHTFNWQETVRIVAAMADALAHAHAQRTIHRDLKPANIILTPDGKPIIVDFGLGLDESEMTGRERGLVAGTPAYMSPEQASGRGHRIDGRTDIYSLGVILYEMITGHVPFRALTSEELLKQVRDDEPQPPRQLVPNIPRALEQVCLKALAKRIQDRFITAGDMAEELNKLLAGTMAAKCAEESCAPTPTLSGLEPPASKSDSVPKGLSSRRRREAERRQLTLLSCRCELFEAADFLESLDYEEQHEIHLLYQELCTRVITEQGGAVIQMTEEATLACFGYPIAHEDAAARAVRTGLALLRELASLRERIRQKHPLTFTTNVYVHTGMAVAGDAPLETGREAFSVVGEARNIITRLEAPTSGDALVISQTTYRLVRGFFVCESLGAVEVKGSKPLECQRVVSENAAQSRIDVAGAAALTPLVGRDREVGLLQDRWEQAVEGMGQVVLIIGDAGLGKSRLIHVIKEHVATQAAESSSDSSKQTGRPIVEWRCTPQHQNSSLYPVIDFFERWLHFEREEPLETKFAKLLARLEASGLAKPDIVTHLAALLSLPVNAPYTPSTLPPARQKEKTLDAILECLRVNAARQPFVFIVEDLHWLDASTLELLTRHVEGGAHDPILTILTFRPEFEPPWKSKAHLTVMPLNRLTRKQITQMMEQKAGVAKLPPALVEQIVAKTDGVPLFVEEYTKMVMESARIREVAGQAEISGSFVTQEIPATLQDLLMARLDRMASNREVVQIGATIGREFSHTLHKAVAAIEETELNAELDKLVLAELLFQKGKPPESTYVFKHALIQDAAYLSQVKSKKQQVHRRVAEALERDFAEVAENQPEVLAHHFTEAGLAAQAIAYWNNAGQRSMARSANVEAAGHLRRGLQMLGTLPDTPERAGQELGMQISLGTVLIGAQGYAAPEVGPVFERARALCQQIGQPQSLLAVLWGIWAWRVVREEFDICLQLADDVLKLADSANDDGIRMEAHFVPALTLFYRGEFAKSLEHSERGLALYDAERCKLWSRFTGQNAGATFRSYKSLALWCLGYPAQALKTGLEGVELARAAAHPFTQCYAIHHLGWLQQHLRLGKESQASAETVLAIAHEQGFTFWKATGTLCRAAAHSLQDKPAEALAQLQQGLTIYRTTGAELSFAHYLGNFAEAHWRLGQYDEALKMCTEAIAAAGKNHNDFFLAELHRLKGEILLAVAGDLVSAEACFQDSLAVALKQNARSWELRTTMSLCRLWHKQGRTSEARTRLAFIYGWFTEGLGTPDLMDARKMLDAWA